MAYVSAAIMEEDFTAHARAHVQNTKVHNYGSSAPDPTHLQGEMGLGTIEQISRPLQGVTVMT